MRVTRQLGQLTLALSFMEGRRLHRVLKAVLENYKIKPGQIPPKVAGVWYSTRGCESAKMSPEETRQWIENLHRDKGSRVALLEDWTRQVSLPEAKHFQIRLSVEQASDLMTALNDHRLWLAARYDIGQAEMDLQSLEAIAQLKSAQQSALFEIHFLAWILEEVLRAMSKGSENC